MIQHLFIIVYDAKNIGRWDVPIIWEYSIVKVQNGYHLISLSPLSISVCAFSIAHSRLCNVGGASTFAHKPYRYFSFGGLLGALQLYITLEEILSNELLHFTAIFVQPFGVIAERILLIHLLVSNFVDTTSTITNQNQKVKAHDLLLIVRLIRKY